MPILKSRQRPSTSSTPSSTQTLKDAPLFSILQAAGWPIWPLLICSVLSLAVIIERAVKLRRTNIAPTGLLEAFLPSLGPRDRLKGNEGHERNELELLTLKESSSLGAILALTYHLHQAQHRAPSFAKNTLDAKAWEQEVRFQMEGLGQQLVNDLNLYLSTLSTIASVAPLLGLLGTVLGMIDIFASQSAIASQPIELSMGISMALYNTAMGLVVAIPSLIAWRFFRARVDLFVGELERAAESAVQTLLKLNDL